MNFLDTFSLAGRTGIVTWITIMCVCCLLAAGCSATTGHSHIKQKASVSFTSPVTQLEQGTITLGYEITR